MAPYVGILIFDRDWKESKLFSRWDDFSLATRNNDIQGREKPTRTSEC